jgi:hypothetical protein
LLLFLTSILPEGTRCCDSIGLLHPILPFRKSAPATRHRRGTIRQEAATIITGAVSVAMKIIDAAETLVNLERMVAAVKGQEGQESKFAKALATLKILSRKEGIPLAIVGGLAAIHHGYERFTKDINVVVRSGNLDILARVAPQYGIKVIWNDPEGWHKLQCEGVPIDVVPEGRKPRKDAPTAIPGPEQLGVREGTGYAEIAGWMETKLGSYRVQDRADVVQVIKAATPAILRRIRKHLGNVHAIYLRRFDELLEAAKKEKEQERERGGARWMLLRSSDVVVNPDTRTRSRSARAGSNSAAPLAR